MMVSPFSEGVRLLDVSVDGVFGEYLPPRRLPPATGTTMFSSARIRRNAQRISSSEQPYQKGLQSPFRRLLPLHSWVWPKHPLFLTLATFERWLRGCEGGSKSETNLISSLGRSVAEPPLVLALFTLFLFRKSRPAPRA